MGRVTSVLCIALLGFTWAGSGARAAEEHPAIEDLAGRGVLRGYPQGKYEPNKPVTRLELAVIVARLLRAIESNPSAAQPASPPKRSTKAAALPSGVPAWARADFRYAAERGYAQALPAICRDLRKPALQKDVTSALVWALASVSRRGYIPPGDLAPPPPELKPE